MPVVLCLLVSTRFQVLFHSPPGVLFTFPSRYYSLSVTWSYLALRDGPRIFRQNSSCSDVLCVSARQSFRLQVCHFLWSGFPTVFDYLQLRFRRSSTPVLRRVPVWPLSRSLAATKKIDLSFSSSGYLDVSVHRVPPVTLFIHVTVTAHYDRRVSPFRHLRIKDYLHLPAAFRSLPRPSSALDA